MAFRYRLRPDGSQLRSCERHCADARFVWNLALEQANWYRPGRPTPGGAERFRQQAMRSWWSGTHRRPTWRKKGFHEGFCLRDVRVRRLSRKWAEVQVPKVGWTLAAGLAVTARGGRPEGRAPSEARTTPLAAA